MDQLELASVGDLPANRSAGSPFGIKKKTANVMNMTASRTTTCPDEAAEDVNQHRVSFKLVSGAPRGAPETVVPFPT